MFIVFIFYLLGSVSVAKMVGQLKGIDPTEAGDKNPGWWNMRSLVGRRLALVVLFGDLFKGALPVFVTLFQIWFDRGFSTDSLFSKMVFAVYMPGDENNTYISMYVSYLFIGAVMLGHAFPILNKFKGGMSILVFAGAMAAMYPLLVLISVMIGLSYQLIAKRFLPNVKQIQAKSYQLMFFSFPFVQGVFAYYNFLSIQNIVLTGILMSFIGLKFAYRSIFSRAKI